MAKKFVRIIEDVEEALAREVRHIVFFQDRYRGEEGISFKELFDPFTGEMKRRPIEPRFYDDSADSLVSTNPRFTLRLLKLYEDLETKRLLPPYGEEITEVIPGPNAYRVKLAGENLITTDGVGSSIVQLTNRKIREIQEGDYLRIITGQNIGTYKVASVALNGNGPHTITLDSVLLDQLPAFDYNKNSGIITFRSFVDLSSVKSGDIFTDANDQDFTITGFNLSDATLAVAAGSALVNGANGIISRSGNVLQGDDEGEEQCFQILDPSQPIANKGTRYSKKSQLIPYTFLYYIKIVSRERDDHIAIADRMMQVFNPPRGMLSTVVRSELSANKLLIKDANAGDKTIFVQDATEFYVNEHVHLLDDLTFDEENVIESVNLQSNSITLKNALQAAHKVNDSALLVSNACLWTFERDFTNHQTEDREDMQLWVHRFTFRVEGWVESRINLTESSLDETTEKEVGDVNFIKACIEDIEGNLLDSELITGE